MLHHSTLLFITAKYYLLQDKQHQHNDFGQHDNHGHDNNASDDSDNDHGYAERHVRK